MVAKNAKGADARRRYSFEQAAHIVEPAVEMQEVPRVDQQVVVQMAGKLVHPCDLLRLVTVTAAAAEMAVGEMQDAQPFPRQAAGAIRQRHIESGHLYGIGFDPSRIGERPQTGQQPASAQPNPCCYPVGMACHVLSFSLECAPP